MCQYIDINDSIKITAWGQETLKIIKMMALAAALVIT
jgi:hypothetical protein